MDQVRFGRQYRALRIRAGKRQQDVADEASLSRSQVAKVDRGELSRVTVDAIPKAVAPLGAELDLRLRWRGEMLDRLLDEDHAAIVETLVRRLRGWGWTVEVETSFSIRGERGSIDVLACHSGSDVLLVVEVKSVVPDSQAMLFGLDRKARLAPELAAERGWSVRCVARLLVIGDSDTSRRRLARLAVTYDAALPSQSDEVRAWLRHPQGPLAGVLFLSYGSHGRTTRRRRGSERVRRSIRARSAPKKTSATGSGPRPKVRPPGASVSDK